MFGGFGDCCGHGWFGEFGSLGWAGLLLNVLFLFGFVIFVIWIVRKVTTSTTGDSSSHFQSYWQSDPKEILAIRYARGDIDREEYSNILADLE